MSWPFTAFWCLSLTRWVLIFWVVRDSLFPESLLNQGSNLQSSTSILVETDQMLALNVRVQKKSSANFVNLFLSDSQRT